MNEAAAAAAFLPYWESIHMGVLRELVLDEC